MNPSNRKAMFAKGESKYCSYCDEFKSENRGLRSEFDTKFGGINSDRVTCRQGHTQEDSDKYRSQLNDPNNAEWIKNQISLQKQWKPKKTN